MRMETETERDSNNNHDDNEELERRHITNEPNTHNIHKLWKPVLASAVRSPQTILIFLYTPRPLPTPATVAATFFYYLSFLNIFHSCLSTPTPMHSYSLCYFVLAQVILTSRDSSMYRSWIQDRGGGQAGILLPLFQWFS